MNTNTAPSMTELAIINAAPLSQEEIDLLFGNPETPPSMSNPLFDDLEVLQVKVAPFVEPVYKTPSAPTTLHNAAIHANLEDGIDCPICGHRYGSAEGFNEPCQHLAAHLGPYGWEQAPSQDAPEGEQAFAHILPLLSNGIAVKVSSGEGDIDWIVWAEPLSQVA